MNPTDGQKDLPASLKLTIFLGRLIALVAVILTCFLGQYWAMPLLALGILLILFGFRRSSQYQRPASLAEIRKRIPVSLVGFGILLAAWYTVASIQHPRNTGVYVVCAMVAFAFSCGFMLLILRRARQRREGQGD